MTHRTLDTPTFLLLVLYLALLGSSVALSWLGLIPLAAAFGISLVAFNLSFTLWHECVHNTLSSSRTFCSTVGVLLSFIMVYPGYFLLRRDHLLHHKYEGDPDKDPVYPRVQCRPWALPFHLARVILVNPQPPNPESRPKPGERVVDGLGYLLFAGVAVLAVLHGKGWLLLFSWVLPRLIILPIHAFYVCYLPHSAHGPATYQKWRIVLRNPLTRYLTLYHSYHGLHHIWPTIPWYRYRRTFEDRRADLEAKGVEILPKP